MADHSTTDTAKDSKSVVVARIFDAPIKSARRAWSDPEYVMRWWGPTGFICRVARMDFREGGTTLVCMRSPEGQDLYNTWTYPKIVPMERIEFVQRFSDGDGRPVELVEVGLPPGIPGVAPHFVTFQAEGSDRTKLTVTEYGYASDQIVDLSRADMEQGLDKMAAMFAGA